MFNVPAPPASPSAKASTQAVWSLVLGILGMTCLWLLGAIPAIILGSLALRNIGQSGGTLGGRGLAISGIVTGSIGIFTGMFFAAILASVTMPAFTRTQDRAQQIREQSNLKQLWLGCRSYASDFEDGSFPETLAALEPDYLEAGFLASISADRDEYLYRAGLSDASPGEEPLLASPAPLGGKRAVCRVDGEVRLVPEAEYQSDYARLFP